MTWTSDELAAYVSQRMTDLGDPGIAAEKAAYMYGKRFRSMRPDMAGADPFAGVQGPDIWLVEREIRSRYPISTPGEYASAVAALWALPRREEKYLAAAVAGRYRTFITMEQLPLYRSLIVQGAWWDLVDSVAPRCVGPVLLSEREDMRPVLDLWIDDDDLWIRRSALLAHLKHKERTDQDQLFDHCERRMHETEFFIRKAIGWVLRQYARTAPDAVKAFALAHRDEMSGLSFREATKHLDV
jgi:3-methyladenine DNA glycosylase AlkD